MLFFKERGVRYPPIIIFNVYSRSIFSPIKRVCVFLFSFRSPAGFLLGSSSNVCTVQRIMKYEIYRPRMAYLRVHNNK